MRSLLALTVVSVIGMGCQQESTAPEAAPTAAAENLPSDALGQHGATLRLAVVEDGADFAVVELSYHPAPDAALPRVAELWLKTGAGLAYESSEARSAVTAAGKTLVVQAKEEGIRSVVFSAQSLETMNAGPIGRYRFKKTDGERFVEVVGKMPTFAPPEANLGVMLPERLMVGGKVTE